MARGVKKLTKEAELAEEKDIVIEENNIDVEESVNVSEPVIEKKPAERKKASKTYGDTDLIPCQSIVSGYMNMFGHKTKITYEFFDKGDIVQVEYQDLRTAMISRDVHLYAPMLVILDEDLLSLPEWSAVKNLYDQLYSKDDLSKILELPLDRMREVVEGLPKGAKTALASIAKAGIDDKTFDSMNKIKALDEMLGTDLLLFMIDEA